MPLTKEDKLDQIFRPYDSRKTNDLSENDTRLAYYTNAETALKIITNDELWFRNASVMNDYSEIEYGLNLIDHFFRSNKGKKFKCAINAINPNVLGKVQKLLDDWVVDWRKETYLACLSLHDKSEDKSGRLSMWRAYGDTAFIIHSKLMTTTGKTDEMGVFSTPVDYLDKGAFEKKFSQIADKIKEEQEFLKSIDEKNLIYNIETMFFLSAIATKHPGFAEEQEWRLYFRPNEYCTQYQKCSPAMKQKTVVLDDIAQTIYALALEHDPAKGLDQVDLPSLLDRLIIGPTAHPYVSQKAFRKVLEEKGVKNVESKVVVSDIPLRI